MSKLWPLPRRLQGPSPGGLTALQVKIFSREFKDEETTNYELGIKSELFNNRLRINATAFYTVFSDLQFFGTAA